MKLYILFGQRKQRYDGQYAPEALAIMDEVAFDINPAWIYDTKNEHEKSDEFDALEVITLEVSDRQIEKRLYPASEPIEADVIG